MTAFKHVFRVLLRSDCAVIRCTLVERGQDYLKDNATTVYVKANDSEEAIRKAVEKYKQFMLGQNL
jgi:hypothetical protein